MRIARSKSLRQSRWLWRRRWPRVAICGYAVCVVLLALLLISSRKTVVWRSASPKEFRTGISRGALFVSMGNIPALARQSPGITKILPAGWHMEANLAEYVPTRPLIESLVYTARDLIWWPRVERPVRATLALTFPSPGGAVHLYSANGTLYLLPLWIPLATMLLLSLLCHMKCRRTSKIARCDRCGYDLRGLPIPRCPECGEPFEALPEVTESTEATPRQ